MPTKRSARCGSRPAAELHRVRHRLAAIVETWSSIELEDGRQIGEHVVAEIAPRDVRAQRQRQARLQEPPLAEVEHLLQALVRVRELALVDDEADVRVACLHLVENLVERHLAVAGRRSPRRTRNAVVMRPGTAISRSARSSSAAALRHDDQP